MSILRPYRGMSPRVHPTAFVAETAVLIGDVEVGPNASIWYGCVLRGDVNRIVIGEGTNIQDGTIVHCDSDKAGDYRETGGGAPCLIGRHITVGHMALLHACVVEDGAFIGMRSVVMDFAVVESGALVGAGALVTPGKRCTAGQVWAGSPAKPMRPITEQEKGYMVWSPRHYAELAASYR
jgi:carbonic anhydrase/acetyltransferase-like protein (isoleucine patch superfamily)